MLDLSSANDTRVCIDHGRWEEDKGSCSGREGGEGGKKEEEEEEETDREERMGRGGNPSTCLLVSPIVYLRFFIFAREDLVPFGNETCPPSKFETKSKQSFIITVGGMFRTRYFQRTIRFLQN